MSKVVGLLVLFASQLSLALVPVEGLILGQANMEYQLDPLAHVFKNQFSLADPKETKKISSYQELIRNGLNLNASCEQQPEPRYSTSWEEKQAQRAVAATAQYIGLDVAVKAIGAYAQLLSMDEDKYNKLADNLITNYCSKNITVYSLRLLRSSLTHYYRDKDLGIIPNVADSPFASDYFKSKTWTEESHRNELNLAIKNFRAFCSWGNDVADYRMMAPFLKNKFFMAEVVKNMSGKKIEQVQKPDFSTTTEINTSVQITCKNLICRKTTPLNFYKEFPKTVGSINDASDLNRLYCHHFRFLDYKNETNPQIKKWIKQTEIEDPILESNFLISLLSGVPDPTLSVTNYADIPLITRSNFNQRWNRWASDILNTFSRDLLFEESLKIKPQERRNRLTLNTAGFGLDFSVTLGEMDRIMNNTDKYKVSFQLKLSKNYMRFLRTKWMSLTNDVDTEGQVNFKKDVANYLEIQIKNKEKLFSQKMWNDEFSGLIADELIGQVLAYKGPLFDSYKDEILEVPVNFSYGVFALGYLHYRSDINAGRPKLNL